LSDVVPLEGLLESEAGVLLSYPVFNCEIATARLDELLSLGVKGIELRGNSLIGRIPVLGKGHVGIVVSALFGGDRVAMKIRRVDADRASMENEAKYLQVANSVSVGPVLLGVSRNFLLMELVEGEFLLDWLGDLGVSEGLLRDLLRSVLERARRLDIVGLDHGELSRAPRHILVAGGVPRIVDFESASLNRRCRNVTSAVQFLFINRLVRGRVERFMELPDKDELLEALRTYRGVPSEVSFQELLAVCSLV
jgi:putative serine/threonine protein kinase